MAQFAPKDPSLGRHRIPEYKTPDIRDLVFFLEFDSKLAPRSDPEYGELYESPDGQYDNYELVHVTAADRKGKVRWYYAAPREDQGSYNFLYKEPSGSQGGYPSYTRSYFVKREDVNEFFAQSFDGSDSVQNIEFTAAGTASVTELVAEVFHQSGSHKGKPVYYSGNGYMCFWNGSFWMLFCGEKSNFDYYISSEDVATPDLCLTWIADFSSHVVTHNIIFDDTYEGLNFLEAGSPDPDRPWNPEFVGFVYTGKDIQRVPDQELDSLYVLVVRKFEKLCPQSGSRINNITGELEDYTVEILPKNDPRAVGLPVDSDGVGVTISPINCDFIRRTTGVVRPFETRSWNTYVNYHWPRVLYDIDLRPYSLNNGDDRFYPHIQWKREAYNGPTKATITETWHATLPVLPDPVVMIPNSIQFPSPIINLNTGPCLHSAFSFQADIGTGDSKWGHNVNTAINYPASSHADWPDAPFISSVEVRPEAGGFIVRTVTIEKPDVAALYPIAP